MTDFYLRGFFRVAARLFPARTNVKTPITPEIIDSIFQLFAAPSCGLERLRVAVIIIISFCGFLRFSDVIQLDGQDIEFVGDKAAKLTIRRSKTDQIGQGQTVIIAASVEGNCPVTLLRRYLLLARIGSDSPLPILRALHNSNGRKSLQNSAKPISYTRTRELVKSALREAGLDPTHFGLHSMRRGGATTAAKKGVPIHLIQQHGRWKSLSSLQLYIENDIDTLLPVSSCLLR